MTKKNETTVEPTSLPPEDRLPEFLPILPMEHFVLFPSMLAPIIVGDDRSKRLVDEVLAGDRMVGVVAKKPDGEDLSAFENLYTIGTSAKILKMLKMPDGTVRLLIHGIQRMKITQSLGNEPYLKARVEPLHEISAGENEAQALLQNIHSLIEKAIQLSSLPDDFRIAAMNLTDPGKLADLVAYNLSLKLPEQQEILEQADVKERLTRILHILNREIQVMELGSQIQSQVRSEMDKNQRDYVLREQMKAIRRELGEDESGARETEELRAKIAAKAMPDYARETANREVQRLGTMQAASAEYTVARTYLEWILDLPWMESTKDSLDVKRAREILDEDHYNLEKIKDRIIEYLSVRKLKQDMHGPILCLVGPPGVGKTSLGRSIARSLDRNFYRISLGGMRDEAEIRGHRRTYIGAMPGRLLKGLKQGKSNNPVIMLDEIDKLSSDYRGDPAAALLEVLDPEQNNTFTDNYLDMPFDLSKVLFITTANQLDTIPAPLRDRMEVLELGGYTVREKVAIARKYIVPKQMHENGITSKQINFAGGTLERIVEGYTREAGLRNLEREIGNVCRKVARMVAEGRRKPVIVTPRTVTEYLGRQKFYKELAQRMSQPGVAIGLAWTSVGGEILFIEASLTNGNGRFMLTGQLGDVMRESGQAALTYVRSIAPQLGIPEEMFGRYDIHMHIPAGAIPKDGPSAGITMAAALASLLTGRRVRSQLAMTGEITIKGNVLPVGGIREKVLAAARAGIDEIILPARNLADTEDLPEDIEAKITFYPVEFAGEVLGVALEPRARKVAPHLPTPIVGVAAKHKA
ncbi:MAG: endopeptidase La [Candidatus Sumerlaeaceae bacterium]|nr:endopeptidase La [Candidatus Sumerlaeaceae bacterium]